MTKPGLPIIKRIAQWAALADSGCLLWQGSTNGRYAKLNVSGQYLYVHRLVYEHHFGPIPSGLVIDHTCGVTTCVHPDHLEATTQQINTLRGDGPLAQSNRHTERRIRGRALQDL